MSGEMRIGCSGWVYDDWRGRLYPEKLPQRRWLERYSQVFDTVEVNSTFYRLASPSGVEKWVEATPAGFTFAVKASRYLTHIKRLTNLDQGVKRFYAPLESMVRSAKLGPVLWQLPENFHRDDDRLAQAVRKLPKGRHCFEFRHQSWFCDPVYELLAARGMALVIGDDPSRPFQAHERTTDWTFIRFHRGNRGRGGNYSRSELETWARRLRQWRRDGDIYAYFNNDWRGFAVENAKLLRRLLGE
ncbi:MAG TPA: DUF72 domain-containing protein [Solirubrobacterales bacterium]|nr:DUF72 domain-containing protein [Solirubrobacterales bacterium]